MYTADPGIRQGGLNASIGDLLPFTLTLTLESGTWDSNTLESPFTYNTVGTIGTIPNQSTVPEPRSLFLLVFGLSTTPFIARKVIWKGQ
jgi:hypothetical protein